MNKTKLLKRASLVAMTAMLPFSQVATAGEVNISGWVNEGMYYYDDGNSSDVSVVQDNGTTLATRINFIGTQELPNSGLTAGFEVSVEPVNGLGADHGITPLLFATQANTGDINDFGSDIGLLGNNIFLSGAFGKLTWGTQSMPTDNIGVLADPSMTLWTSVSPVFRGNGFTIQGLGAGAANTTWGSNLTCRTSGLGIGFDCNGVYRNGIRYDLPAFAGIKVAVGYANDDIYDIAAKWDGDVAGLKASIHGGYNIISSTVIGGDDGETFQVTGGLMDPGTGLFINVSYMKDEVDGAPATTATTFTSDEVDSYFIKGGIKRDFNSLGPTVLGLIYGSYNDGFAAADTGVTGSEVERFGVSVTQYFGAGFQIYGTWEQLDLDVDCGGTAASAATCATNYGGADELDMFALGATYFF